MRNLVLSKSSQLSGTRLFALQPIYPGLRLSRAASLNNAIGRGIRRSQGVGFRGKERARNEDLSDGGRGGPVRRTADPKLNIDPRSQVTGRGWKESARGTSTPSRTYTPREPDRKPARESLRSGRMENSSMRIRMGKRVVKESLDPKRSRNTSRSDDPDRRPGRRDSDTGKEPEESLTRGSRFSRGNTKPFSKPSKYNRRGSGAPSGPFDRSTSHATESRPSGRWEKSTSYSEKSGERMESAKPTYPSLSPRSSYSLKSGDSNTDKLSFVRGSSRQDDIRKREQEVDRDTRYPSSVRSDNDSRSQFAPAIDKRMPISIPYTTPASEFLYGTSVVEAALRSKKDPRRKHYKLYIYTGEKRDAVERDAELERMARRNGVEVKRVTGDWLPLLDKMSAGRPHNGYILEASPLPKLPVTSLGEITNRDDQPGFDVVLDHQSREEAAINGSSNFVKLSRFSQRKPLVLFLDSILDPGNLGGIIRTASFLGVTAIAISKNCAPFSPVVLKASAGASEDVTIFSVNKPAGFIASSKLAGWKIYAAVAPSGEKYPNSSSRISTDDLADPLSEDPCILMLGSEGEGLRTNLKSKADVNLSIRGSGRNLNIDSLNVSVATGILCNSFFRRNRVTSKASPDERATEKELEGKPDSGLF